MDFQFHLIDYTFNALGATTKIKMPLEWDKLKIKSSRDFKTHGVVFEITDISLGFVDDGYIIIDTAYQAKGADAETELLVEIKCSDTDSYEQFYTGVLRYAEIKYTLGDFCRIEIPCQQTGCVQTFKNRIEQKVDLESLLTFDRGALTAYEIPKNLLLPSKEIILISNAALENYNPSYTDESPRLNGITANYFFAWEFSKIIIDDNKGFNSFECLDAGEEFFIEDYMKSCFGIYAPEDEIICRTQTVNINYKIKGHFDEYAPRDRTYKTDWILAYGNEDDGFTFDNLIPEVSYNPLAFATNTINFDIDYPKTVTLRPNKDRLYIVFAILDYQYLSGSSGVFTLDAFFDSGCIYLKTTSICDATDVKLFPVNETLSRITESITDNCLKVYSDYFGRTDSEPFTAGSDGCGSLEALTNGFFIRRATKTTADTGACDTDTPPETDNFQFFLSFKDGFDGLNAIHNIGIGIDEYYGQDVLRIEAIPFFYQFEVILEINDPMEIKIDFDTKRVYSIVKIGYEKWETEYSGGLDEIQTKREYRTESKAVNSDKTDKGGGTLEQNSKFIASNYAIELTKRQGQTTKDWRYDNDTFIICLVRGESVALEVETLHIFTNGILSPPLINARLTPVRNLMRWFKTVAASWTKQWTTAGQLIFTAGDGNYKAGIQAVDNDDCLNEKQADKLYENEVIKKSKFKDEDNAKPLWEPELIKFDAPLSWQNWKLLKANPYKLIKVTKGSNVYYGWQEEISYPPEEGGLTNFTLLRAFDAENRIP